VGEGAAGAKARRARRLPLAAADRFDAGPVDLAVEARGVQREGEAYRREGREVQAGEGQAGIDQDQEDERRQRPEKVDQGLDRAAQDGAAGQARSPAPARP